MSDQEAQNEALWRTIMLEGETSLRSSRILLKVLPASPRCKFCGTPFGGVGAVVARTFYHKERSTRNPLMCNVCEVVAREHPGGAEVELSMLFADVRGSTTLAEQISPSEFTRLMNRFFNSATDVVAAADGFISRFAGDAVISFFVPGLAGPHHSGQAFHAAQSLLRAVGYGGSQRPWLPVGIGIHTGVAFAGAVGAESGAVDITALGDSVNVGARLSSVAAAGEILASDALVQAAGLDTSGLEHRELTLKGRSEPVGVHVLHA